MIKQNKLKKGKICCFGELLLRYSPEMQGKFIQDQVMPVYVGGAELNVATALAQWMVPVSYVTALPPNYLSDEIKQSIAGKNIDTDKIKICGERIGIYYLPQGSDMKNNAVIYDRAYSSFSMLKPGDIDWDEVLDQVEWFHLSAISPALSQQVADLCLQGVKAAAAKNITISIDLNYRAKLWQYGVEPSKIMSPIVSYCHIIMGNIWAADTLLGIKFKEQLIDDTSDVNYLEAAEDSAKKIMQVYPSCTTVANTFRFDKGQGIKYFASLHTRDKHFHSSTFTAENITDKVGSGDCFMAGLVYGIYNLFEPQYTIEYAAAAAYSKLFEKGDATSHSVNEVKNNMLHG